MAFHDMMIPVDLKLTVDTTTAEACLKIVELYMNQHPELEIIAHTCDKGRVAYEFEARPVP